MTSPLISVLKVDPFFSLFFYPGGLVPYNRTVLTNLGGIAIGLGLQNARPVRIYGKDPAS